MGTSGARSEEGGELVVCDGRRREPQELDGAAQGRHEGLGAESGARPAEGCESGNGGREEREQQYEREVKLVDRFDVARDIVDKQSSRVRGTFGVDRQVG